MSELFHLPKHVVLDLDGTLIDIRRKYYAVYKDITYGTPLPESLYWRLKRIKKLPPSDGRFIKAIESETYLTFDTLFPFSVTILQSLINTDHILHLVSARRNAAAGYKEVERFGIAKYFQSIDIGHNGSDVVSTKTAFLASRFSGEDPFTLVGDTEDDITTAKTVGRAIIAVSSGIRTAAYLSRYKPDLLGDDIRVLVPLIQLIDFSKKHR